MSEEQELSGPRPVGAPETGGPHVLRFGAAPPRAPRPRAAPPEALALARARRGFVRRVVGYLAADLGVRQFVNVGARPATAEAVHTAAREHRPEASAVHLSGGPLGTVLRSGALDPAAPIALLLVDTGDLTDTAVAALVRDAHAATAPGSHVVICRPAPGDGAGARAATRLFAPFTVLDPGLADMAWWPYPDAEVTGSGVGVLAGVAGRA
ncbi:S-adenosyl methyltransferase [Murinocardiopsis flavida]|uniref:S-adenosyl methyltransferase n=1 Tax=Murinocardiopsis flavida TaxID=645275 RepID=A0A2P8DI26_9ACTN|nr:SAM-dependent methyltransferase [Murinocardiopsis flavida]PSK96851.1 S-adenosyl methyltransferase [Murinocardiopsis flavida]